MWTLMQSDMCNRNQDLVTSVAIKADFNETLHTHAHLENWQRKPDVNIQYDLHRHGHRWERLPYISIQDGLMIDTVCTQCGKKDALV